MPQYRYYTADILTGAVLAELPLYGVYMQRQLSAAGDFAGTYQLGTGQHDDRELLEGSTPGKCAVYVERDGTLIWGGILWSRTWAEESLTVNLTGQTWESVWNHTIIEQDFVHQTEDQMQIFKALVDAIQLQDGNNFGIDSSGIGSSGINRTVLVPGYEYHMAQEVVDQLVGVDSGFDYTIDIVPGSITDQPFKIIRAGYPKLSNAPGTNASYEFPGNIDKFWWPESATRGGTKFASMGAGAGIGMLRSVQFNQDLRAAGYPAWWKVSSYKGVTNQNMLDDLTSADRELYSIPVSSPTLQIKSDAIPQFDRWNDIGAYFDIHLESKRFPDGKDYTSRMVAWDMNVASSDDVEILNITVEGDKDDTTS